MLHVACRVGQRTARSSTHAPLKYPPILRSRAKRFFFGAVTESFLFVLDFVALVAVVDLRADFPEVDEMRVTRTLVFPSDADCFFVAIVMCSSY